MGKTTAWRPTDISSPSRPLPPIRSQRNLGERSNSSAKRFTHKRKRTQLLAKPENRILQVPQNEGARISRLLIFNSSVFQYQGGDRRRLPEDCHLNPAEKSASRSSLRKGSPVLEPKRFTIRNQVFRDIDPRLHTPWWRWTARSRSATPESSLKKLPHLLRINCARGYIRYPCGLTARWVSQQPLPTHIAQAAPPLCERLGRVKPCACRQWFVLHCGHGQQTQHIRRGQP